MLALLSAAFYGAADFAGGFASRRAPMFSVVTISQLAGLVSLLLVLPLLRAGLADRRRLWPGARPAASPAASAWRCCIARWPSARWASSRRRPRCARWAFPSSPACALGDRPGALVGAGIALAIVAIVLLGQESAHPDHPAPKPRQAGLPAGMWHALASGVAIGCFFLLLARTRPEAGLWPLVAARVAGIPCFAAIVARQRRVVPDAARLACGWCIGGGVLDMLANVLYLLATRYGSLAVAVTLVSLYPASTVALARVVLKERLSRLQVLGMVGALVAVLLIVQGG